MPPDSTRRLHHATPAWVAGGAVFHVRIRIDRRWGGSLTATSLGQSLLNSTRHYHRTGRWHCHLLLLMPDHLHALLAFPALASMAKTVGQWKSWHRRQQRVIWQDNFFDHRIRNEAELQVKADYIRRNPVVKGLCASPPDWPWMLDENSL